MAKRISDLRTTNKAGNTSREYVLLSNIDSNSSTKIALNDIFPTLQSGKITTVGRTAGSSGEAPQDLFVGGGVGSNTANTDKSILIFKGIETSNLGGSRALLVQTDKSTADGTKQSIVISLNQTLLDLSVANNATSEFLSESGGSNPLNLSTSSIAGTLPVTRGGTGATTFTDGGLLVGNATGAIQSTGVFAAGSLLVGAGGTSAPNELTVGTDGYALLADSSTATGLKWGKPAFTATTFSADITMGNNNIILGTGYLKGNTGSGGFSLSTSTNYGYIGTGTKYFDNMLNVDGSISLGANLGNTAQTIKHKNCTTGPSPALSITGSDNSDSSTGGNINITAGAGDLNSDGGNITISSGAGAGIGNDGSVVLKAGPTNGLVIDYNQDVSIPNGQLRLEQAEPIGVRGTTSVIQATSLTTGVTLNSSAGVITLHATALSGHDSAYFTLTNSVINIRSIIMLTTRVSNAEASGAGLVAQVSDIAAGSCKIRVSNTGNSTTTTDHSVHFFIVNEVV